MRVNPLKHCIYLRRIRDKLAKDVEYQDIILSAIGEGVNIREVVIELNKDDRSAGNGPLTKAAQDLEDFNNEVAGRDVGRIRRFLPEQVSPSEIRKRHRRDQARVSALMKLLQTDSEYLELYTATFDALRAAELATEKALHSAELAAEQARRELDDLTQRAATLPDGTKVFRDKTGKFWDARGRAVSQEALVGIEWPNGAPGYEDYLIRKQSLDQAQSNIGTIREYQVDVLGYARDRMMDENDPPASDALQDIQRRIDQEMPPEVRTILRPAARPARHPSADLSGIKLPTLAP